MRRINVSTRKRLADICAESSRQRAFVEAQLTEIKLKINAERAGIDSPAEVHDIYEKYRPMRLSLLEQIECLRKAKAMQQEEACKQKSEAREAELKRHIDAVGEIQRKRAKFSGPELSRYKENLVNEALKTDGNAV